MSPHSGSPVLSPPAPSLDLPSPLLSFSSPSILLSVSFFPSSASLSGHLSLFRSLPFPSTSLHLGDFTWRQTYRPMAFSTTLLGCPMTVARWIHLKCCRGCCSCFRGSQSGHLRKNLQVKKKWSPTEFQPSNVEKKSTFSLPISFSPFPLSSFPFPSLFDLSFALKTQFLHLSQRSTFHGSDNLALGEVRTINDRNICERRSCMKHNGKSSTFKFVSGEERRPSEVQRVSRDWRLPGATHSSADLTWIRKWLKTQAPELSELESVGLELGSCCSNFDKQVSDEICRTRKRQFEIQFRL